MEINVLDVSLKGATQVVYFQQKDLASRICPICCSGDDSFLLADIRAGGQISLESAFCERYEHRYLRKLPTPEWFQRYYSNEWDKGRTISDKQKPPLLGILNTSRKWISNLLRPIKRFLKNEFQIFNPCITGNTRAIQLFPLLLGITEGSGGFYLPKPELTKVLEIGCGYGELLQVFNRKGFFAVGTEASPYRVQSCLKKGLRVVLCSLTDLEPVEYLGPFDFVYSTHVLEHTFDPSMHLKNLVALIRNGGYLYIQVPNLMHEVNFFHQCHTTTHCHSFSPRSLSLLLEHHGLTPVRMQVDNDIHIIARKAPSTRASFTYLFPYRHTADPQNFLDLIKDLQAEKNKKLRIIWDHANFRIIRVEDGKEIYRRMMHLKIAELPKAATMDFSLNREDSQPSFPVHFNYQGDKPPVWVKMN